MNCKLHIAFNAIVHSCPLNCKIEPSSEKPKGYKTSLKKKLYFKKKSVDARSLELVLLKNRKQIVHWITNQKFYEAYLQNQFLIFHFFMLHLLLYRINLETSFL